MGQSFTPELIRLLKEAGCMFVRHGKGDHAHFSDRGRRFRRDRGRRFSVIVDDHGSTRVTGFIVSQSSTMAPKR
jgi:hypothetical protein